MLLYYKNSRALRNAIAWTQHRRACARRRYRGYDWPIQTEPLSSAPKEGSSAPYVALGVPSLVPKLDAFREQNFTRSR